jgi:hypothetical protein
MFEGRNVGAVLCFLLCPFSPLKFFLPTLKKTIFYVVNLVVILTRYQLFVTSSQLHVLPAKVRIAESNSIVSIAVRLFSEEHLILA